MLYDAMNLTVVNAIPAHTSSPTCVAFNQAGTILATSSEKVRPVVLHSQRSTGNVVLFWARVL